MKNSIKEKLRGLIDYFCSTRQVGHTHALLLGDSENNIILAANEQHAQTLKILGFKSEVISINNLYRLRGARKPLVLDNHTLLTLMSEALNEINALEAKSKNLEYKLQAIKHIISQ